MLQCSRDVLCVCCTAFGADGNKSTAQCSHIQVAAPCLIVQVLHAALRYHDRVLEVVEHACRKHGGMEPYEQWRLRRAYKARHTGTPGAQQTYGASRPA